MISIVPTNTKGEWLSEDKRYLARLRYNIHAGDYMLEADQPVVVLKVHGLLGSRAYYLVETMEEERVWLSERNIIRD